MPKQYEIMLCEPARLLLNIANDTRKNASNTYKKNGNIIGGLAIKTDDLNDDYPDPKRKNDEFLNENYGRMMDASICISDKDLKQLLQKHKISLKPTDKFLSISLADKPKWFKKLTGIKLLVEEVDILDCSDVSFEDEPDYDTKNNIFNPEFYDPDDWEFVLRVKNII